MYTDLITASNEITVCIINASLLGMDCLTHVAAFCSLSAVWLPKRAKSLASRVRGNTVARTCGAFNALVKVDKGGASDCTSDRRVRKLKFRQKSQQLQVCIVHFLYNYSTGPVLRSLPAA
jgi:hypothetical protein